MSLIGNAARDFHIPSDIEMRTNNYNSITSYAIATLIIFFSPFIFPMRLPTRSKCASRFDPGRQSTMKIAAARFRFPVVTVFNRAEITRVAFTDGI